MRKMYEFEVTLEKVTIYGYGENESEALQDAEESFCRDYLTKDIDFESYKVVGCEDEDK